MWKNVRGNFDQHIWNQFVEQHGPESGRFLQSWQWGEFQKAVGKNVDRWIENKNAIISVATIIKYTLSRFGSYGYCPCGPVTVNQYEQTVSNLIDQNQDLLFLRVDFPQPQNELPSFWKKSIDIQPKHTWMTNLSHSQDELLTRMRSKTRYNIGLAKRHNILIDLNWKDFESIWPLFKETSVRGKFRLHPKSYYERMLKHIPFAFCAVAHDDAYKIVAANLMIDFGGVRTYLHGASAYVDRTLMAPYLLHWELIKDAQLKGLCTYDWWGVAPSNMQNHPWVGISRFKQGFPGREVETGGTYDFVKKPFWYTLYRFARTFRRL